MAIEIPLTGQALVFVYYIEIVYLSWLHQLHREVRSKKIMIFPLLLSSTIVLSLLKKNCILSETKYFIYGLQDWENKFRRFIIYILRICVLSYGKVLMYLFMNANKWVIILSYKVERCALTHISEREAWYLYDFLTWEFGSARAPRSQ